MSAVKKINRAVSPRGFLTRVSTNVGTSTRVVPRYGTKCGGRSPWARLPAPNRAVAACSVVDGIAS